MTKLLFLIMESAKTKQDNTVPYTKSGDYYVNIIDMKP